ncbi:MAG: hypothetical protein LKM45_06795, partial [Wolbachia endosymbiont of Alcedoecus sp.]|nr:hypothetical protein [Wolbachia endosymbiont of Alcedoecus sp.]
EHKEVKTTSSLKSKVSSFFRGNKAPKKAQETTGVKYQVLSEPGAMPSAGIGNSIFYVAPQKPPRSNSPSPVTDSTVIPNDRSSRNKVIIGEYSEEEEKKQLASSTATVDPTRLRRNSLPSSLYDGPPVLNPVTPPKAPESPTSSRDSGINSDSSTPPKLFKLPVPPKPLAVNLAEARRKLRRTDSHTLPRTYTSTAHIKLEQPVLDRNRAN